jgi:hypothetical protein
MRLPFAMMALAGALVAPIALAQMPVPSPTNPAAGPRPVGNIPPLSPTSPATSQGNPPAGNSSGGRPPLLSNGGLFEKPAPAPKDPRVFEASTSLPTPTIPDQVPGPTIELPNDPIGPFLLTRGAGPFMVMAKTFRGPDAERWALALVLELRNEYRLPAYILRTRDFPMRSNIRNIPPTAVRMQQQAEVGLPEKVRTYDEAVVLVGDEKTLHASEVLLHKVKCIKPKCLNGNPSIFHWREGLNTAMRTTNPYVPAQDLFPRKNDPLVMKMNGGPHSLFHCPGHYSLQVAEFGGRATIVTELKQTKQPLKALSDLVEDSPLEKAYDEAEELAEKLAKNPEVQKTGWQPYVFHDRTTSKVMMGAFNSPDDPAAAKLRNTLLRLAVDLAPKKTDTMIVPAPYLTDVEVLKASAH